MSQGNGDEDEDVGQAKRNAIPLMAAATLISQLFMCLSVSAGDYYTKQGVGRKILFLVGLITLPLRCLLIILCKDAGSKVLLLTQILDGIEGGLFRVIHPYIVVDLTFGTGRFNIISKLIQRRIFSFIIHEALDNATNTFLSAQWALPTAFFGLEERHRHSLGKYAWSDLDMLTP